MNIELAQFMLTEAELWWRLPLALVATFIVMGIIALCIDDHKECCDCERCGGMFPLARMVRFRTSSDPRHVGRLLCKFCVRSLALLVIALAIIATGCAVNRPVLNETVTTTNGIITTKSLRMTSFAIWPATTTVDKQRGSVGKTLSVGTEGAELETSNTNAAATLRELRLLLESLR